MRSVVEALELLVRDMRLTKTRKARVNRQYEVLQQELRERLEPVTDFLSGSYSRNTSIHPLHDIDLFVVMGVVESAPRSLLGSVQNGRSPDALLKQVRQALKEAWPEKELPILQRHSVNIGFSDSGIDFDVVPAFALPDGKSYLIPERDSERWVRSNPRRHKNLSIRANERSGKKLKPLLKLVKLWNRVQRSPLKSFHLEAMSYDALPKSMDGYLEPLEVLFSYLARAVMLPCRDPAGLGPNLDEGLIDTQRESARQLLQSAARTVRLVREEMYSSPARAHARLRELFGERYPERGS